MKTKIEEIAEAIATKLLTPSGKPEAHRLKIIAKGKRGGGAPYEVDQGGWAKSAVVDLVVKTLNEQLPESFDRNGFVEWLELMAGFALMDMMASLDDGNLKAAQAHSERLKLLESISPWIKINNAYLSIKLKSTQ